LIRNFGCVRVLVRSVEPPAAVLIEGRKNSRRDRIKTYGGRLLRRLETRKNHDEINAGLFTGSGAWPSTVPIDISVLQNQSGPQPASYRDHASVYHIIPGRLYYSTSSVKTSQSVNRIKFQGERPSPSGPRSILSPLKKITWLLNTTVLSYFMCYTRIQHCNSRSARYSQVRIKRMTSYA
jgi:hypothetical protein